MENKVEKVSIISLILGVIFVFWDSPTWYWSILFISLAVILPLVKSMWSVAGWASDRIGRL